MGLSVVLENERGSPIQIVIDPKNYLHRLLPSVDDQSYQCLRFIDWYGYTVFNHLQMPTFLEEWQRLKDKTNSEEEIQLLLKIENLAFDCQSEQHEYLRFIGD